MGLFKPSKKRVLVAEEHSGPMDRKVYDYRNLSVTGYEREREGQDEQVRPYTQTRKVRAPEAKPHWYSLRRKREPEPTFLEKAGDAAGEQADFMET